MTATAADRGYPFTMTLAEATRRILADAQRVKSAADRDELARGSHLTTAQIAAMDDATVARLVALMRDRADVARDEEQER